MTDKIAWTALFLALIPIVKWLWDNVFWKG